MDGMVPNAATTMHDNGRWTTFDFFALVVVPLAIWEELWRSSRHRALLVESVIVALVVGLSRAHDTDQRQTNVDRAPHHL